MAVNEKEIATDPAQEFAERVVDIVCYAEEKGFKEHLVNIVANKLPAEGWVDKKNLCQRHKPGKRGSMATQRLDPAQEFAERVAEKWNSRVGNGMEGLVSTIASELRAGGWVQGADVAEDAADDFTTARRHLEEIRKDRLGPLHGLMPPGPL